MVAVRKLLVANRAEIASRICSTARRMGITTVAVFSDPDAELPFVRAADEAVRLPGASPSETYLNISSLLDAAKRSGADAVHPGYGFLSEHAGFARACLQEGLTFVGPPPSCIEAMGSKTAAKSLMERSGVPVLPGAEVKGPEDMAAARALGAPLLVKAVFGGGGRGMRVVLDPAFLPDAVASAQREAEAAFGDPSVFVERFVERPRHVEVQVMADQHGTIVALGERDCSVQRRHQKLVEETPSPAVSAELRATLAEAAVAAARAIGYVGAGTVEFVLAPDHSFYFLEVNTRLQVEHPVTEMVTGLDLVELQLRVARGEPLPDACRSARPRGHAIEVRLYAEDVRRDFLPSSGRLARLFFPALPSVRVDVGYESGSTVSRHYDAMVAKVIAWAPDRQMALARLTGALASTRVHGVAHNKDLLEAVLKHPEFVAGEADTAFLERHPPSELLGPTEEASVPHAAVAALAAAAARCEASPVQRHVPPGWRNVPSGWPETRLVDQADGTTRTVQYRLPGHKPLPCPVTLRVDGQALEADLYDLHPDSVDIALGGLRRCFDVHWVHMGDDDAEGTVFVDSPLGSTTFVEEARFPAPRQAVSAGSLTAPLPGSVVRVAVEPGTEVSEGDLLVVLEAMKMEHEVRAPRGGRVAQVRVATGDQLEPGQVLVVVEESDDLASSDGNQPP